VATVRRLPQPDLLLVLRGVVVVVVVWVFRVRPPPVRRLMRPGLLVVVVCLVVRGARVVRGERLLPNMLFDGLIDSEVAECGCCG
jgi:hypothetical protein